MDIMKKNLRYICVAQNELANEKKSKWHRKEAKNVIKKSVAPQSSNEMNKKYNNINEWTDIKQ